ncbi:MAG: NADH-quinone oxidoreductase subunit C [Burkholderiales bacterium]
MSTDAMRIDAATLFDAVRADLGAHCTSAAESFGTLVLELPVAEVLPVVSRLRDRFGFTIFLDVTAIDWPERVPRFDVVWHFLCPQAVRRIRLKAQVGVEDPAVPTLTPLYGSARFMEREAHDMYGIVFAGNGDLRPILLYEGFVGHPLRKDYAMEHEQPIVPYREGKA